MWSRLVVVKKFTMIKPARQLLSYYKHTNNNGKALLPIQFIVFALVAFEAVVNGVPVTVTTDITTVRTTRCFIPNNKENGTCLEASRCPPYIRLKSLSDVTLDTSLEYLTSVHCENETNIGEPLVCCPTDGSKDYEQSLYHSPPARKLKKQKRRISLVTESGIVNGECGKQVTNRIYGGEIAELDEYPWMVLLVYNSSEYKW